MYKIFREMREQVISRVDIKSKTFILYTAYET